MKNESQTPPTPNAYTGLIVKDPGRARDFYTEHLSFEVTIELPTYVHLKAPGGQMELALLKAGELNHMPQLEQPSEGCGLWLGLYVEDVDEESARLWDAGVTIVQPPTDQPWGERTLVIQDPDGTVIYLAHKLTNPQSINNEELVATN